MKRSSHVTNYLTFREVARPSLMGWTMPLAAWASLGLPACSPEPSDAFDSKEQHLSVEPDGDLSELDESTVEKRMTDMGDAPYVHPLLNPETAHLLPIWLDKDHARGTANTAVAIMDGGRIEEEGGQEVRFSGLVELPKRKMTPQERTHAAVDKPPRVGRVRTDKISSDLMRKLSTAESDDQEFDVLISFKRQHEEPIFSQMEDALARGEVRTHREYENERQRLTLLKRQHLREQSIAAMEAVSSKGPSILVDNSHAGAARAKLRQSDIVELASRSDIRGVYFNAKINADSPDGDVVREVTQIKQLLDDDYDGQRAWELGNTSWAITFAQVENQGADDDHAVFLQNSNSANGTRIRGMYDCGSSSCTLLSASGFTTSQKGTTGHATRVAATIFADLTQGQDSGVTSTSERSKRSGMSRESKGFFIRASSTSEVESSLSTIASLNPLPRVVNMSAGAYADDLDDFIQDGSHPNDIAVNDLFESGALLIKTAGNGGNANVNVVTTNVPASAIGAFTVGGIGTDAVGSVPATTDDVAGWRTALPYNGTSGASYADGTSRGRASNDPYGRSVVDIAAPAHISRRATLSGGYATNNYGTSFAAPIVTGAAIDYIDWYKSNLSNWVDNPGALFSMMLLWGNRMTESGSKAGDEVFDPLLGAGHLRVRRFDEVGLDNPAYFAFSSACVPDDDIVEVPLGTLSSDIDGILAVAFWYDARHGTSGTLDDIDMRLFKNGSQVGLSNGYDNKERIYEPSPGGGTFKLELSGWDVTSDNISGCGTNAMRVYYAWYAEDSDRESAENLDDVEPM